MAQLKCHGMCIRGSSSELLLASNDLKRTLVGDIRSLRLITGIKTLYLQNGTLDLKAYDVLIDMQIAQGVEGVIVASTAGEGHLMSWDERMMLIEHTVARYGALLKVIGNTGIESTSEAMQATERGFAVGMHASRHINPYHGTTSIPGLLAHFNSVLPMGPMIIYNMPSLTGQDIPPSLVQTLAASPNFLSVKECVYDRVRQYAEEGKTVWCGMDYECHDARWDLGAMGAMSVTSNLISGLMRELVTGKKSSSLNEKVMPLIEWLLEKPNPIGLNTALAQLGVVRPVFKLPYVPLPPLKRLEFVGLVKDIGREHFVGDGEVQVPDDDDFILVGGR